MPWDGDYMAVIQEIMLDRPMDDVYPAVTLRNPLYSRIMSTTRKEDFYGKRAKLTFENSFDMNAGPRPELADVQFPGQDDFGELFLNVQQYMASIGWSQEVAEDAIRKGGGAVVDLVERKMANAFKDLRFKLEVVFGGDGTGRLGRVSAWTDGTLTVGVDNLEADFGWDGTAYIKKGMYVDIYTVPDITPLAGGSAWTTKCLNVKVVSVNKAAGTFVVSGHTVDPANSDFVFLAGSVKLDAANKFLSWNNAMGLQGIVDDGVCTGIPGAATGAFNDASAAANYNGCWQGPTFQGLTRASYAMFNSLVRRAGDWGGGTDGTKTTCDLSVITDTIRMIDEEGDGGGQVSALYMNGKTRDWMAALAFATNNGFVNADSGKIIPGMTIQSFRTSTGKLLPVIPMSTLPNGTIIGGDESDLVLFEQVPIGWYNYNGQRAFMAPGSRNLTFESWLRTKLQLGAKRCDNWFKIEDIDTDA